MEKRRSAVSEGRRFFDRDDEEKGRKMTDSTHSTRLTPHSFNELQDEL